MTGRRNAADQGQLALQFTHDRGSLEKALRDMTGRSVSLTVTDNTTSMLSVRNGPEGPCVRVHRIFLDAGPEVLGEVCGFITGRVRRTPLIREYVRKRTEALPRRRPRLWKPRAAGRWYDLEEIFNRLNTEYFGDRLAVLIGWGTRFSRRAVKKRTLGSYCRRTNRIRINPALDSPRVPVCFVEFVVYHEMLHADVGAVRIGRRTCVHTKEFKERERRFAKYEMAVRWEKAGR